MSDASAEVRPIPENPADVQRQPSPMPPTLVSFPQAWDATLEALRVAMGVESKELAVARAIATLSQTDVLNNTAYVVIRGQKKTLPLWEKT